MTNPPRARFHFLPAVGLFLAALAGGCSTGDPAPPRADPAGATAPAPNGPPPPPAKAAARPRPAAPATGANREGEAVTESLAFPTGDRATSVLLVEKIFPAQARLGKAYRYELKVSNLTDGPISAVVVRERVPESFRLARPGPATDPATQPAAPEPREGIDPRDGQEVQQYVVGDLGPRESRGVSVVGVAGKLGKLPTYTSVTYTPLLAGGTEVINPILRLTKDGPPRADLCSEIVWRYVVGNVGTGTETRVHIDEPLPPGLLTVDGKTAVAIDVGNLPEGTSRDFSVRLKAAAVGRYAGRATARGAGTEAASAEVATLVQAPKLTVAVTGPETEYVGKTAAYDLVVTNTGDAPARDTLVAASADNGAELVFFAGIRPDAPEPRIGGPDNTPSQNLGTVEPGQSKRARVAFRPTQAGPVTVSVSAKAACADAVAAKTRTAAQTIAALVMEVRSRDDLVRVGEDAVYTIRVKNQGTGADANVRVAATLPAQLALVKTAGPTDAKVDGPRLVFAPLAKLAPGETATWTVEAKAADAADVRFKVELTSDSRPEPALETAPTKLY